MDIKETALKHLNKEYEKLLKSVDWANTKPNVSQDEIKSLHQKLRINLYLRRLVAEKGD